MAFASSLPQQMGRGKPHLSGTLPEPRPVRRVFPRQVAHRPPAAEPWARGGSRRGRRADAPPGPIGPGVPGRDVIHPTTGERDEPGRRPARIEMRVACSALFEPFPTLCLAGPGRVDPADDRVPRSSCRSCSTRGRAPAAAFLLRAPSGAGGAGHRAPPAGKRPVLPGNAHLIAAERAVGHHLQVPRVGFGSARDIQFQHQRPARARGQPPASAGKLAESRRSSSRPWPARYPATCCGRAPDTRTCDRRGRFRPSPPSL